MNSSANQQGYIALLAVLVVGAASIAIALALLVNGTDSQRSTLVQQQAAQARNLATACVEEALQLMHDTSSYTGTGNLTLGQGTCTYTVTNTGGINRTIVASGIVNEITRKLNVYVIMGSPSISISSWEEVS